MVTVLCFGTFDGVHPGHEAFFRQARDLGDRVVVVVARDVTVLDVKGQLPGLGEQERLRQVAAHPYVEEAHLGHPGDKYAIIEQIKPDMILLGYDQQAFTDALEEELARRGLLIEIRRAHPHVPEVFKTSLRRPAFVPVQIDPSEEGLPL